MNNRWKQTGLRLLVLLAIGFWAGTTTGTALPVAAETITASPATLTTDKHDINGDSFTDEVYEISTASELFWFSQQVNEGNTGINAILTKSINLSQLPSWEPIGSSDWYGYRGIFDGNGKTISGLTISSSDSYLGLFGVLKQDGIIRNVTLENPSITVTSMVGAICGWNNNGTIENCTVRGTGSDGGSISNANNSTYSNYTGGICGNNSGLIRNCSVTGAITIQGSTDNSSYTGGICGLNHYSGSITLCSFTGTSVTGYGSVGGICGENFSSITNCYNAGLVDGTLHTETISSRVGGVCGKNIYNPDQKENTDIESCYNLGTITYTDSNFAGSVCGENADGNIENCYAIKDDDLSAIGSGTESDELNIHDIEKKETQFSNGEVAYLLQKGQSSPIWGQKLSGDDKQTSPVFSADQVYRYTCGEHVYYTNTSEKESPATHTFCDEDGTCNTTDETCGYCGAYNINYSGLSVVQGNQNLIYNRRNQSPDFVLTNHGKTLVCGVDYTEQMTCAEDSGTYTAIFKGIGTYAGTRTVEWTIEKADSAPEAPSNALLEVPCYYETVEDITTLPVNWEWSEEDKSKELSLDKEITATAVYQGYGKGNYKTESIEIPIKKVHTHGLKDAVIENEIPATCTKAGSYDEIIYCVGYSKISRKTITVKAKGHSWDNGVVTKQATAQSTGTKTYTCTSCKAKKTEIIPALPVKNGTKLVDPSTKNKYTVTNVSKKEVSYTGIGKSTTKISIPKTVKISGITYKVTAISSNALKNNKKITKVTIGSNVASIGKNAFYGCKKLKSITIKTSKLTSKKVGKNAFKKTGSAYYRKVVVKVPAKKVNSYKKILKKAGLSSKAKVKK